MTVEEFKTAYAAGRRDFSSLDLSGADLSGADLSRATLYGADLSGANLSGAKNLDPLASAQTEIIPREGTVVGWKKCQRDAIVKLLIPAEAHRSNATGRKCRASEVVVLAVEGAEYGVSMYNSTTEYHAGQTVKCGEWNPDRFRECAGGIHFFLTREEAEAFTL